jgi:hypothetical protein
MLLPLLIAVAPSPLPSSTIDADHVFGLAGTWTCRGVDGSILRQTGRRDGVLLDVAIEGQSLAGAHFVVDDRFTFDRASGTWAVRLRGGAPGAAQGTAPPWTGAVWEFMTHPTQGPDERVRYELLSDGDVRLTTAEPAAAPSGAWRPTGAELCAPGAEPPPADACIVENFPGFTIEAAQPAIPGPPRPLHGRIVVIVSLDADSDVVATRIQSSPETAFNVYALDAVRRSIFHTTIRNCKPVAADFVFTIYLGLP